MKKNKTLTLLKTKRLNSYLNEITKFRVLYLIENIVYPQINEISDDQDFFFWCLAETGIEEVIIQNKQDIPATNVVLWCIFMSNEKVYKTYNQKFNKGFLNCRPWSDICDLYLTMISNQYYQKIEKIEGLKEFVKSGLFSEVDNETYLGLNYLCREAV